MAQFTSTLKHIVITVALISLLVSSLGCSLANYGIGKKIDNYNDIHDTDLLYQIGDDISPAKLRKNVGDRISIQLAKGKPISGELISSDDESLEIMILGKGRSYAMVVISYNDVKSIYRAENSITTRWIGLSIGLAADVGIYFAIIALQGAAAAISSMGA